MSPYRIKPAALADMEAIAEFIRQDNPQRADSFAAELIAKIETIAERPLSFPPRPELAAGVRSALHGNYLIFFLFENDQIDILHVVHGARDFEGLF